MNTELLMAKFAARDAHVAVVGLGYVGLPLAVTFAEAGYCVTGIDLDARKIEALNRGESYIEDVPAAKVAAWTAAAEPAAAAESLVVAAAVMPLSERINGHRAHTQPAKPRGMFTATTDFSVATDAHATWVAFS